MKERDISNTEKKEKKRQEQHDTKRHERGLLPSLVSGLVAFGL
jgi:hypothetical protein